MSKFKKTGSLGEIMIGILALAIILYWVLVQHRHTLSTKIIVSFLIVLSYAVFLKRQGASTEQMLDILFSFG